jgi:hypothetical protein
VNFKIVYDLGAENYPLISTLIGAALAGFFIGAIFCCRYVAKTRWAALRLWIAVTVVGSVGVSFLFEYYSTYTELADAIAQGRAQTIAGRINNFSPAVGGRGASSVESFLVGDEVFSYRYSVSPGFSKTAIAGGVLRTGLFVGITFVEFGGSNVITKLEVAE